MNNRIVRNEIGGDFHMEQRQRYAGGVRNIYAYLKDYEALFFDSGRSALRYLLRQLDVRHALLPNYICESVYQCFTDYEVSFYNVSKDFTVEWDALFSLFPNIDLLYLSFFNGYIDSQFSIEKILSLQKKYGFIIVEDTTHSIFTALRTVGDYCVCSLRKWFPIPDGGVLYTKKKLKDAALPPNEWYPEKWSAMKLKTHYLSGEDVRKEDFWNVMKSCEAHLDAQENCYSMSYIAKEQLIAFDVDGMIKKRLENLNFLVPELEKQGFHIVALSGKNQVPLFCTIILECRDSLRNYMKDNAIFLPVHWPQFRETESFPDACYISTHELSIPIDHRYSIKDMERVVKTICYYKGDK